MDQTPSLPPPVFLLTLPTLIFGTYPKVCIAISGESLFVQYHLGKKKACLPTFNQECWQKHRFTLIEDTQAILSDDLRLKFEDTKGVIRSH